MTTKTTTIPITPHGLEELQQGHGKTLRNHGPLVFLTTRIATRPGWRYPASVGADESDTHVELLCLTTEDAWHTYRVFVTKHGDEITDPHANVAADTYKCSFVFRGQLYHLFWWLEGVDS